VSTKAPKRKRAAAAQNAAPVATPEADAAQLQAADTATLAILAPTSVETADPMAPEMAEVTSLEAAADATAIMEAPIVDMPVATAPVPADQVLESQMPVDAIDPIIALPSNSTVKDASALKVELLKLLEVPAPVVIDVRSVERVDTATIQLLYAFVRDRAERNGMVEWLGSPAVIVDAVRLLGVQDVLAIPTAGAA
jgi:ABC-type transporter Mla MlaB component